MPTQTIVLNAKYTAHSEEEIRNIIESLIEEDSVFTHYSGLCKEADKTCGYIFHTVNPTPFFQSVELHPNGTPWMIAKFLAENFDKMDTGDKSPIGFHRAWIIDMMQVGDSRSIFACVQHVPPVVSTARH